MLSNNHDNSVSEPFWTFLTTRTENRPPITPDRPSGPGSGTDNEVYEYNSSASHPDGDILFHRFNWGDGTTGQWIGPYASGEMGIASHLWESTGSYAITIQSKDDHGLESTWSDPLPVNMPRLIT